MAKLWLDEAGNVKKVEITKGVRKDLDDAALAAAQEWRFKPAKKNGKPIAVWITIPFRFKISAY
jgi:protein TonB